MPLLILSLAHVFTPLTFCLDRGAASVRKHDGVRLVGRILIQRSTAHFNENILLTRSIQIYTNQILILDPVSLVEFIYFYTRFLRFNVFLYMYVYLLIHNK